MIHISHLQALVEHDTYTKNLNFKISIAESEHVQLTAPIDDLHCNGFGTPHGGYLVSLADCAAMYVAFMDGSHYVTQSCNFSFLRSTRSLSELLVDSYILKRGKTVTVVHVEIHDSTKQLLCDGTFSCYRISK